MAQLKCPHCGKLGPEWHAHHHIEGLHPDWYSAVLLPPEWAWPHADGSACDGSHTDAPLPAVCIVGDGQTAEACDDGYAETGDRGYAIAGNRGHASVGADGFAESIGGYVRGGPRSIIRLWRYDGPNCIPVTGQIGTDGLKPDTWYCLDDQDQFVCANVEN